MVTPNSPDDLLSTAEACQILQVHPNTLRRWADQGSLPSVRTPGNLRRFRRDDVEALLAPSSEPAS